MNSAIKWGAAIVAGLVLTACGDGSSSSSTTTNQDPQGIYIGQATSSSSNYSVATAILQDGTYYTLYSNPTNNSICSNCVEGLNFGTISVTGNTYKGDVTDLHLALNNPKFIGSISGSFVPNASLQGQIDKDTAGKQPVMNGFTSTYRPSYNTPATLSAIAGTYSNPVYVATTNATLTINQADGSIQGTTTTNFGTSQAKPQCVFTGKVVPSSSGKNIYDLYMAWQDPDPKNPTCCYQGVCSTNLNKKSGIAFMDGSNLYTAWIDPDHNQDVGFFWRGAKQ